MRNSLPSLNPRGLLLLLLFIVYNKHHTCECEAEWAYVFRKTTYFSNLFLFGLNRKSLLSILTFNSACYTQTILYFRLLGFIQLQRAVKKQVSVQRH